MTRRNPQSVDFIPAVSVPESDINREWTEHTGLIHELVKERLSLWGLEKAPPWSTPAATPA